MKIYSQLLALCFFHANVWGTTAFTVKGPKAPSAVVLRSSSSASKASSDLDMFPTPPRLETIQGGNTVKTYPMPPWAERCQVVLKTNGRPLRATVELWIGPIRRVHQMIMDVEDGSKTPFRATMKFKKAAPVLKICTSDTLELAVLADVSVPSPQRAEELAAHTDKVWNKCTPEQKQLIQGGSTEGGGGAIRSWEIPSDVDSVQLIAWSKDVGKKSLRAKIEVLQGPNCKKQEYTLQCGGGSQPYHAVIQTPGEGWVIRMQNLKFLEDGLVQFAVVPYNVVGKAAAVSSGPDRQWWE